MVYIEVLLSVLKKFRGLLRLEHWLKILLSLANGQHKADCHGSVTKPFADDRAAASRTSAPLHDNGQFLRKTWRPSEKIPSTLQRAFLPLAGGYSKKRSACLHDRRFREAAAIRLCPSNLRRFPAITGRYRPPRPAAAGARRTPDTARSAVARPPRDSSARRPPFCGWTAPRKIAF